MLFAFDLRNFILVKLSSSILIFLHKKSSSIFVSLLIFWFGYIPPPVLSYIFFYFRKVAQIILSLFFWSLLCFLTLKLCCSDPTWQSVRPEFDSSLGRSAETTSTAQTGVSRNSVFRSYTTCCDTSILLISSCAGYAELCEQGGVWTDRLQCYTQTEILSFCGQYNNMPVAAAVSRTLHCSPSRSDASLHFKVSSMLLQESCLRQQIPFPQNQFSISDLRPSYSKKFLLHTLTYHHSPKISCLKLATGYRGPWVIITPYYTNQNYPLLPVMLFCTYQSYLAFKYNYLFLFNIMMSVAVGWVYLSGRAKCYKNTHNKPVLIMHSRSCGQSSSQTDVSKTQV